MYKIVFALFLLFNLVYANDNTQATLGDVKEAVYKLIVQNKKIIERANETDSKSLVTQTRVTKMESTSKEMLDLESNSTDNIDRFIDNYALTNADVLLKIANK